MPLTFHVHAHDDIFGFDDVIIRSKELIGGLVAEI